MIIDRLKKAWAYLFQNERYNDTIRLQQIKRIHCGVHRFAESIELATSDMDEKLLKLRFGQYSGLIKEIIEGEYIQLALTPPEPVVESLDEFNHYVSQIDNNGDTDVDLGLQLVAAGKVVAVLRTIESKLKQQIDTLKQKLIVVT